VVVWFGVAPFSGAPVSSERIPESGIIKLGSAFSGTTLQLLTMIT